IGDGAEEPHLATPSAFRQRHRDRLLTRVESHVGRILFHGSSRMPEALTGIAGSTLDPGMQRDGSPRAQAGMWSRLRISRLPPIHAPALSYAGRSQNDASCTPVTLQSERKAPRPSSPATAARR